MAMRTIAIIALVAGIGSILWGQENYTTIDVGGHLVIRMTGDLAKEYTRRTSARKSDADSAGLEIHTTATVVQNLDDGRIRIEHSSPIRIDNKTSRLITLTGIVDPKRVKCIVVPKNTPVYSSPKDAQDGVKPGLTPKDYNEYRLDLPDLKGLKLQTWELKEEIGD